MKRKGRYIKHVENISQMEFCHNGILCSMAAKITGSDSRQTFMVVLREDGEVERMPIDQITWDFEQVKLSFHDGQCFYAVRILWSDGTWEYGLKRSKSASRIYRKNGVLSSLYARLGILDESTGEIVDDMTAIAPIWTVHLARRYNEKIRDMLEESDDDNAIWKKVRDWIGSSSVGNNKYVHWDADKKLPLGIDICRDFPSIDTSSGQWSIHQVECQTQTCVYTYLKSIYHDHVKYIREYKVFPLSDVLMLVKQRWDNNAGQWIDDKEIWNSLDETCKGNV